mmetsp:Transcript_3981/g.5045  ORF Transcript_3981/g.5045 Transcript_3981/m.5045 type:complete len:121 (-) Transcript_3981:682-1044(-)
MSSLQSPNNKTKKKLARKHSPSPLQSVREVKTPSPFTFRAQLSKGKRPMTDKHALERQMKMQNFLQDIEYQRIEKAAKPDFYCERLAFYISQAAIIILCTLLFGLSVSESDNLPCMEDPM